VWFVAASFPNACLRCHRTSSSLIVRVQKASLVTSRLIRTPGNNKVIVSPSRLIHFAGR
jgi:hypothetical protein